MFFAPRYSPYINSLNQLFFYLLSRVLGAEQIEVVAAQVLINLGVSLSYRATISEVLGAVANSHAEIS